MKALTLHAPGDLRFEEVGEPRLAEATDAIVQVELGALCGSDLHVFHGRERGLDPGTVLGHEFLGEVLEVGAGVERFRRGDRVVSPFSTSCGACPPCRAGLTARCERGQLFGWVEGGRGLQGAQAERVRVPLADSTLVEVPAGMDLEPALLCGDVLSTGLFCAESAEVGPGRVAAVVGCGPVGLMAIVSARELGASRVLAVDSVPERLALAARFGAEPVDRGAEDPLERILDETAGRGADCALEAVGTPASMELAFSVLRPGGTLAAVGVHTAEHLPFSPAAAYDRNLTLRTGRCPARSLMERALAIVSAGSAPIADIVSHRLPLEEGPRAYELFDRRLEGCTKVLFAPRPTARGSGSPRSAGPR
ncbi:MAG: alcohol dehydrogenase family protein [Planctomycetota bacterium]|nr:alcohol dehydrogenase family protein [Planctomycetota bacterium]MDP6764246.1 alcohol dehydrogenase family protein [Planctomycetota bacterium]MDP6990404.1 alcohol dehydrogenase family protein [Planctomycetota bacterium]